MKFPHDINEKLEISNKRYSREKVTLTKCKYTVEFCLRLCVAVMTNMIDGVKQPQEGRWCKTFVYSGNMLLIKTGFEKKFQNEIGRVKVLKGGHTSGWVTFSVRTEDKLYLDDPITKLKNWA